MTKSEQKQFKLLKQEINRLKTELENMTGMYKIICDREFELKKRIEDAPAMTGEGVNWDGHLCVDWTMMSDTTAAETLGIQPEQIKTFKLLEVSE